MNLDHNLIVESNLDQDASPWESTSLLCSVFDKSPDGFMYVARVRENYREKLKTVLANDLIVLSDFHGVYSLTNNYVVIAARYDYLEETILSIST